LPVKVKRVKATIYGPPPNCSTGCPIPVDEGPQEKKKKKPRMRGINGRHDGRGSNRGKTGLQK